MHLFYLPILLIVAATHSDIRLGLSIRTLRQGGFYLPPVLFHPRDGLPHLCIDKGGPIHEVFVNGELIGVFEGDPFAALSGRRNHPIAALSGRGTRGFHYFRLILSPVGTKRLTRSFLKGFGAFFLMPPPYSWRKREPMEGHPDTA